MIDIHAETLISLSEAGRSLPHSPSAATLWRWYTRGFDGVRLETAKIGKRRYTSREALQRFVSATTEAVKPDLETSADDGAPKRSEANERRLRQNGLLT